MPVKDNFCKSCLWWSYTFTNGGNKFGTCENVFVTERLRVTEDYDSIENDDPTIFTDSNFGCVYHGIEQGYKIFDDDGN